MRELAASALAAVMFFGYSSIPGNETDDTIDVSDMTLVFDDGVEFEPVEPSESLPEPGIAAGCECDCDERCDELQQQIDELRDEVASVQVPAPEPHTHPHVEPAPIVINEPPIVIEEPIIVEPVKRITEYTPRWHNYDGLSFRDHAEIMHGIDTTGLTDAEVGMLRDADHDRYGPGHPNAVSTPVRQRSVTVTRGVSNCPGGVCPTTSRVRTSRGGLLGFGILGRRR